MVPPPDSYFHIDRGAWIPDCRAGRISDLYVPPDTFLGQHVDDILPNDAVTLFRHDLNLHRESGGIIDWIYQFEFRRETQALEASICTISGTDEMVIVVRNIYRRRQAELEKRRRKIGLSGSCETFTAR